MFELIDRNSFSSRSVMVGRLFAASSSAVVASVIVDSPSFLWGRAGELSTNGKNFALFLVVLGFSSMGLHWWNKRGAGAVTWLFFCASILGFSVTTVHDPLTSGTLTVWLSYVASRIFLESGEGKTQRIQKRLQKLRRARSKRKIMGNRHVNIQDNQNRFGSFDEELAGYSPLKKWLAKYRRAYSHLLLVSMAQTLVVFGFRMTTDRLAVDVVLFMNFIVLFMGAKFCWLMIRHDKHTRKEGIFGAALLVVGIAVSFFSPFLGPFILFSFQVAVTFMIFFRSPYLREAAAKFENAPAVTLILSFIILIFFGALFLSLPQASADGQSMGVTNAIFMAVSASCVTGLSVLDVGKDLSGFGQTVLLALIQLGGLGIMVISTFATIALGGRLGIRAGRAFSNFLELKGARSTNKLILFIVKSTLAIEGAGASLLYFVYRDGGMDHLSALKNAVFHAVSAFCNAGFALSGDSLQGLSRQPFGLAVISVLIVLGSLGFLVMFEGLTYIQGKRQLKLSVHFKLVTFLTGAFIFGGWLLFCSTEWYGVLSNLSTGDKLVNGLFHSITLRTAGFHTFEVAQMGYASVIAMLFFMFIGGAPGGTSGGVKVTTFGVLFATLPALLRSSGSVYLFKRYLNPRTIYKAAAIVSLTLSSIGIVLFILFLTQDVEPVALIFEVFSAAGTVGLSLGATSQLDGFGLMALALTMFLGRVGPLTVAIALGKELRTKIRYADANVLIG